MPPRAVRRSSRSSSHPSVRPACLPRMPHGSHHLIRSPLPVSSAPPRVSLLASFPRLSHRLIGSPLVSYRLAPRCIDKRGGERTQSAGGHRQAVGGRLGGSSLRGCGCLLASDGGGRSSAADGGRRRVAAACLPRGDGRCGSVISLPHLVDSSNRHGSRLIPSIISSSHRRGGVFLFFSFRLTPSRLLFSVCLLWLVPPSPAGGCVGCGMTCGGGRAGCLLAFLVPRSALSLPLVRSLLYALCRSCRSFLFGVLWGVLWAILPAILSALAFLKTCP